jgi:glycosyltransferase involved in cell wall biosynthesis
MEDAGRGARFSVVVPAYHEEARIAGTVARLRAALEPIARDGGVEIVVVDDGSMDGTAEAARHAGADSVIVLQQNTGKGAAVRAGVAAATGRTIAFTDADLSYPPNQLLRLLEAVEAGTPVVVGSRLHPDAATVVRTSALRQLTGKVFNAVTAMLLLHGRRRDTQCGLKAFRSDAARLLFSHGRIDGFAFDVELFVLADRFGLEVVEVPVTLANTSSSTVRVAPATVDMLRDLARIRRNAARGVYDRPVG